MAMKLFFTVSCIIFFIATIQGQIENQVKDRSGDAFTELDGKLTVHFVDALTAKPIANGKVVLDDIGTFETDHNGHIFFSTELIEAKILMTFSHPKYITTELYLEILVNSLFHNRYSISPLLPLGYVRIILDWGEKPPDLDLHLVKNSHYHISYRNMKTAADGTAKLDRDDINGFGPETITITKVDENAQYEVYVHDFTNRDRPSGDALGKSKASIKVYGEQNKLLEVFSVNQNFTGNKWSVFKIINGKIVY